MVIHADGGDEPGLIDVDFNEFYSRGYRRCSALGYVLTGSAVDADDLVQEAFSTAYRRWSEIAAYDDPLAWVRKVMVNNAMSRGRRLRREVLAMARFGNRPSSLRRRSTQRTGSCGSWSASCRSNSRQRSRCTTSTICPSSQLPVCWAAQPEP